MALLQWQAKMFGISMMCWDGRTLGIKKRITGNGNVSNQVANLLGESPDYLPSMIPLDLGYTYASAAAERTEYGYFVTFYETKDLFRLMMLR